TSSLKVDGHRADLVILRGAQAHAALQGRETINDQDILLAAELALPHRVKSRPYPESNVDFFDLEERLERAESEWGSGENGAPDESAETSPVKKNRRWTLRAAKRPTWARRKPARRACRRPLRTPTGGKG